MNINLKRKNESKATGIKRNKAGVIHDPDLQFDAVMLDNGVILEHRPDEYPSLARTTTICSTPVCTSRITS